LSFPADPDTSELGEPWPRCLHLACVRRQTHSSNQPAHHAALQTVEAEAQSWPGIGHYCAAARVGRTASGGAGCGAKAPPLAARHRGRTRVSTDYSHHLFSPFYPLFLRSDVSDEDTSDLALDVSRDGRGPSSKKGEKQWPRQGVRFEIGRLQTSDLKKKPISKNHSVHTYVSIHIPEFRSRKRGRVRQKTTRGILALQHPDRTP